MIKEISPSSLPKLAECALFTGAPGSSPAAERGTLLDRAIRELLVDDPTTYDGLTAEDQAVFDQALKGFVGVQYVPFEVCTQVVAGTNYRFKCKSTVPLAKPIHGEAVVQIFKSLDGDAHITSITPI